MSFSIRNMNIRSFRLFLNVSTRKDCNSELVRSLFSLLESNKKIVNQSVNYHREYQPLDNEGEDVPLFDSEQLF